MHKRKVRKEHAVPPTTSTYNEILKTVRDSWIGATAISPSSRSHNLGYSVDRSRLLNRSNSHQPIVTVNNLGYSVDRSRLLNRSNSHQPIVTVNNIGSSVHHQSGFQSNDWHQLAPKDLFMVVTNDHTTYDSQKQAAKVVNINKDIHYTHTKQFICTFGKGENPSLDSTAGAKCSYKTVYMYIWKGGKSFPRHHKCSCYNNLKSTKFLSQCNVCISPSTSYNTKGQTYRDRVSKWVSSFLTAHKHNVGHLVPLQVKNQERKSNITYRDRQSTLLSLYEQGTSATDRQTEKLTTLLRL